MINLYQDISSVIGNHRNGTVLEYLKDRSAHSDVAEALAAVVRPLGDVQIVSPDAAQYRYIAVATITVIFGFAIGMDTVAFRLNQQLKERALQSGGMDLTAAGRDWVSFSVFRDDWPEDDLMFWARKAYAFAREG